MSIARRRRRRKTICLPKIKQLALVGHTGRAIATELGLPPRTVSQWLHEILTEQELVGLYSHLKIRREQASFDPKSPGPSFIIGETWPS
jgi:hypothetical protein